MQDSGIQVLFQGNNLLRIIQGLGVTIGISILSVLLSMMFGTVMGIIMTSHSRIVRFLTRLYLEFIRIMPQLVLLFIVYFGLARNFNINISGETSAIIVFTLWGTAEMGDLVRGAITSLPKHQFESGQALGLTNVQLYYHIIIPQVLRRLLPQAINLVTRMIKTTSLSIQGGDILLDGQSIIGNQKDFHLVRQKIGMVFQSYELFPHLDVLQNLILGPIKAQGRDKKEVTEEALQLLERVGLLDKQHSFARQLSGGQKQRVAIVRALLMHPEIILFDEVTASLDPEMVREVLELINDLAQEGRTMILVTHEMQFAQAIADRIIFLDQGKIAEEGTAQAFFTNPQTKRAQEFLNVFDFSQFGSYL